MSCEWVTGCEWGWDLSDLAVFSFYILRAFFFANIGFGQVRYGVVLQPSWILRW